jgi:hypothetical protein
MWVRKTPEEIARKKTKLWKAFGGPVLFALLVCACWIVRDLVDFRDGPDAGRPVGGPVNVNRLLWQAAVSLPFVAGLAYLLQLMIGMPFLELGVGPSKVLICDKCYRTKNPDGQGSCDCGGTFEDFSLWKWVDDPASQEGAEENEPLAAALVGEDVEPSLRRNATRGTDGIGSGVASWNARMAAPCTGNPRVRGIWNPARLIRRGERTLTLEATYDPPGTVLLAIVAAAIAVAIAVVAKASPPLLGFLSSSGVIVSFVGILLWRKRSATVSLEIAADVIVDHRHGRIAFFVPLDYKPRWIILEVKEAFPDAADAVRDVFGAKCRADTIRGGNVWIVILWLLVGFGIAFGYFRMKW